MKIVYLSNSAVPSRTANSVHVMKMCQALAKMGHEVILLTQDNELVDQDCNNIYKFYEVDPIFQIERVSYPRNVKGSGYIYGLKASLIAKKMKADIVYGRHIPGLFFSAKLFRTYSILELHQPILNKKLTNFMFNSFIKTKKFNKIIVITKALESFYKQKYSLTNAQTFVAHDGADIPTQEIRDIELGGVNYLNIGYVGQLYKGKGMEIIVELARQYPEGDFHIIGGLEKDINDWSSRTKGLSNIFFYGFVPHAETGSYIKACDIMIAPYKNEVYGYGMKNNNINLADWMSPLKIFEYMSYGKPILTSSLPVLKEILTHKENAFLCDANIIDSWVNALNELKKNKVLREKVGNNAKKEFIDKYTWDKRAEKISDAITRLDK